MYKLIEDNKTIAVVMDLDKARKFAFSYTQSNCSTVSIIEYNENVFKEKYITEYNRYGEGSANG